MNFIECPRCTVNYDEKDLEPSIQDPTIMICPACSLEENILNALSNNPDLEKCQKQN